MRPSPPASAPSKTARPSWPRRSDKAAASRGGLSICRCSGWAWCEAHVPSLAQYNALRRKTAGEDVMSRSTTSIRLDDELRGQLAIAAAAEGATVTDLIERYVREGLAVAAHPGIVFKPGPSGRRAALAGGPDVWEVMSALRHVSGSEAKRIAVLAEQLGLHERQVVMALNYAGAHREEVEARVRANDRALEEAERVAEERDRLLA